MTQIHPERCVDNTQNPTGGSSANHISINLGGATLIVVCILAAIIGAAGVAMGLNISEQHALVREVDRQNSQLAREFDRDTAITNEHLQDLQRQYRMTELKLDDWTVVAHRSGLVLPGDYIRGPQGNPDSESFKPKRK